MSIRVPCDSCLQFVSHDFQWKNLKLMISIITRFAKVCSGVYGISCILFLSPLPVLQKQVVTLVLTQRKEKCIYMSSCEVLPLNSQSDVNIQYRYLLSLLI